MQKFRVVELTSRDGSIKFQVEMRVKIFFWVPIGSRHNEFSWAEAHMNAVKNKFVIKKRVCGPEE